MFTQQYQCLYFAAFISWVCSDVMLSLAIVISTYQYHHCRYYIHGRSVQGFSDVGLREMRDQMKKEADELTGLSISMEEYHVYWLFALTLNRCNQILWTGRRGLEPNSDNQTFEIFVPHALRIQYDSVYANILSDVRHVNIISKLLIDLLFCRIQRNASTKRRKGCVSSNNIQNYACSVVTGRAGWPADGSDDLRTSHHQQVSFGVSGPCVSRSRLLCTGSVYDQW